MREVNKIIYNGGMRKAPLDSGLFKKILIFLEKIIKNLVNKKNKTHVFSHNIMRGYLREV